MPDSPTPVRSYGAPIGAEEPGRTTAVRPTARAPTDAEVKAAYQKYMRDVVAAAHQHFHEHVQRVRGSSQSAAPSPTRGIPRVDKAVRDAGG